jgi:hypothetical protein
MEVSNKLPRALTSGFGYVGRYQLFKWRYQYAGEEHIQPFSQTILPEKMAEIAAHYYMAIKNVENTSYIWDYEIFEYLVCDVRYFHSIYLISDEEKELIKKDLYTLLDYMSEVAVRGCWPENGNKVNLYISQINIDTNYSYYHSDELKLCRIHAFVKNEIYTSNPMILNNFRAWLQLKKRSSIQISEVGLKSNISFFMKQRELIDAL